MIKPSEEVLQSIVNLQNTNPESWNRFVGWFVESHLGHLTVSVHIASEVEARWMDGRCQELQDVIQFINNAEEVLKTLRQPEPDTILSSSALLD